MRKSFLLCFVVVFFTSFLNASEKRDFYISGKLGSSLISFDDSKYYSQIAGDQSSEYDRTHDDSNFLGTFSLGYRVNSLFRTELEYAYRSDFKYVKNPTNTGIANASQTSKIQTLMLQGFYDIDISSKFTPYLLVGLGLAHHDFDFYARTILGGTVYSGNTSNTELAWNIGLGVSYPISENIDLDLSYRYISLGNAKWESHAVGDRGYGDADFTSNEFLLGIRYSF
jgi:opacity protein-like surface antigen